MLIGDKVRLIRRKYDDTQTTAASKLSMTPQSFSRLETNQRHASYEEIEKIAAYGSLLVQQLVEWKIEDEPYLIYYAKIRDEKDDEIKRLKIEIEDRDRLIKAIQEGGQGGRYF